MLYIIEGYNVYLLLLTTTNHRKTHTMNKNTIIRNFIFLVNNDSTRNTILEKLLLLDEYNNAFDKFVNDEECMLPRGRRISCWNIGFGHGTLCDLGVDLEQDLIFDAARNIRNKVIDALNVMDDLKLVRLYKSFM